MEAVPEYRYVAIGRNGAKRHGKVQGQDQETAEIALRKSGLYVLEIKPIAKAEGDGPWWKREIYFGPKVSTKDFAVFCRQLSTLIRAGVTLSDSVRVMVEQTERKPLRDSLRAVASALDDGMQLSQAVASHPDIFKPIFVNMVRAGETSGDLDASLDRVARHFEKEFVTQEKIKSALAYPVVVGIIAVFVTMFLLIKMVPTFVVAFAQYGAKLPLPTRIIMALSHFVSRFWWLLLILVVLIVVGDRFLRRYPRYEKARDICLLRLPIFGKLTQKALIARMSRTMSSLVSSAVPLLQGLHVTGEIVDNTLVTETLRKSAINLQGGQSLARPFKESKWVPPLVSEMLLIGEQTGSLDFMLDKIADFYEAEVEANANQLKSLLEPLMIVFLAVIVGIIVLALLLPSFTLLQAMH